MAAELINKNIRIIDISADFRLKNPDTWEKWYGKNHSAKSLLSECVYGLPEIPSQRKRKLKRH